MNLGIFDTLMKEFVAEDPTGFKNLMRMNRNMFQEILKSRTMHVLFLWGPVA